MNRHCAYTMNRHCAYTTTVCIQKCLLRCFNSGPISQISSQIFCQKWSLIANRSYIIFEHIPNKIISKRSNLPCLKNP